MNIHIVFYVLGWILLFEGALMLMPMGVSLIYGEMSGAAAFLAAAALCGLLGVLLMCKKPKDRVMHTREGFAITALSWIVMSLMGALPFLFGGVIKSPVDALFETVSGFTTTGASILPEVEGIPKGMLFWRSFTHWIGGMGVLVFLLMLKPMTGASNINLMRAESPGPQVEKLVPKLQSTARILYGIYIVMTLLQIIMLLAGKMPLFDAVTTTFGTAGTGGFGIKNDSIAGYSAYIQIVVTVFMILFGVNFSFYFFLLQRKPKRALAMEEVRRYLTVIAASVIAITVNIRGLYPTVGQALKHSAFQVGSIITTTGFATTDFNLWPGFSKTILVMLMFIGACAGSTGGGIKVSRVMILFRSVSGELKRLLHPQSINKISVDKKSLDNGVLRSTNVFLVTYVIIFVISVLLIALDENDLVTNFTAVAATLNNIGPGLELVGPTRNFGLFSNFSKLVLIFDMLAGRLELFPMLMLFKRDTWRKF